MESLADQIQCRAQEAASLYHPLVLVVGPRGSGKTSALRTVRDRTGAPLVNVSLELARRMLELTERERAVHLAELLDDIVRQAETDEENPVAAKPIGMVLLDNIEIVFDPVLKGDPLVLLKRLSRDRRDRVIVAAWPGAVAGGQLTYAVPGHPEHRSDPVADWQVVQAGANHMGASAVDPGSRAT